MLIRILLWAVVIGSIIMGIIGVQTGSATNAAVGIAILLIGAFLLFFLLKLFLHFGFFLVKLLLIIGLIALIAVAGVKSCQFLMGDKSPAPSVSEQPSPAEENITLSSEFPAQSGWVQKMKNLLSFPKAQEPTSYPQPVRVTQRPLPKSVSGQVTEVRSGYLFRIDNHFIKLYGIDAPDPQQTCINSRGETYDCGRKSKLMLERLILNAYLTCQVAGGDYHQNFIATCKIQETDVGAAMILAGWAVADRRATAVYTPYEAEANQKQAGLWAGKFVAPWDARAKRTKSSEIKAKRKQKSFWESLF